MTLKMDEKATALNNKKHNFITRWLEKRAQAKMKKGELEYALELASSPYKEDQLKAISELYKLADTKEARKQLVEMLLLPDSEVRKAAAEILRLIVLDKEELKMMEKMLESDMAEEQLENLVLSLKEIRDQRTAEMLVKLAKECIKKNNYKLGKCITAAMQTIGVEGLSWKEQKKLYMDYVGQKDGIDKAVAHMILGNKNEGLVATDERVKIRIKDAACELYGNSWKEK